MQKEETGYVRKKIMLIAGEASADHHGAKLLRALRKKNPRCVFFGIGGPLLREAGMETPVDASELSHVGITEALGGIVSILRAMSRARDMLQKRRPDLLILIDLPDFNLPVAAFAKKLGIKVLYYISPQIWAWRRGRVKMIGERVDHMAVILPFEEIFYRRHHIPVTFAGHPLMDKEIPVRKKDFTRTPVVALLPGSRKGEIRRLLPPMLEAAEKLRQRIHGIRFVLSHSPSVDRAFLEDFSAASPCRAEVEIESGGLEKVFEKCSFAIAVSGTVTLETALAGIPMVIIYKVSPVSYRLGKLLIKVPCISLVNLISGRMLVPELIQQDSSPDNIANTVSAMLKDIPGLIRLRKDLLFLRRRMGGPGASERVAELAMHMLGRPQQTEK
ncbi:MAG: lipid-A-disaccharide synthase [Desulfococcaceae bacterium]|jgi:lipid-A-disaccharide synthase|nr:lipid-A-disaccharide synthase [Desulfococcaceae bacterium]